MKQELNKEAKDLIAKVKKLFGKKMKKGLSTREIAKELCGVDDNSTRMRLLHLLRVLTVDPKSEIKYTPNPEGSKRPGLWSRKDVDPAFEGDICRHRAPCIPAVAPVAEKPVKAKAVKEEKAAKAPVKAVKAAKVSAAPAKAETVAKAVKAAPSKKEAKVEKPAKKVAAEKKPVKTKAKKA